MHNSKSKIESFLESPPWLKKNQPGPILKTNTDLYERDQRMFDASLFLERCPWISDLANGTELLIAWATEGRTRMEMTQQVFAFEDKADDILEHVDMVVDSLDAKLEERLRPIQDALTTKVSTKKGKVGEAMYDTWASEFERVWNTECTKSIPHSGDYIHRHHDTGKKVIADVKNYGSSVPTKEIDKLWDDMKAQTIPLGLLVSTSSKITGRRPGLDIEFRVVDGVPSTVVFVSNAIQQKDLVFVGLEILRIHSPSKTFEINPILEPVRELVQMVKESESTLAKYQQQVSGSYKRMDRILKTLLE